MKMSQIGGLNHTQTLLICQRKISSDWPSPHIWFTTKHPWAWVWISANTLGVKMIIEEWRRTFKETTRSASHLPLTNQQTGSLLHLRPPENATAAHSNSKLKSKVKFFSAKPMNFRKLDLQCWSGRPPVDLSEKPHKLTDHHGEEGTPSASQRDSTKAAVTTRMVV